MRSIRIFFFLIILASCSFNDNSRYWNEHNEKRIAKEIELNEIIKKSKDITLITMDEYEIYIEDYTKKSKYPNINK